MVEGQPYREKQLMKIISINAHEVDENLVLVSLFNSISTLVGYLMPKPSLLINSSTIWVVSDGIRRPLPFPRALVQKWM